MSYADENYLIIVIMPDFFQLSSSPVFPSYFEGVLQTG
jgi:hypothetical protein